jgi:hypothetical protein
MARILPLLTALIVVLGTGLVHGLWTGRWQFGQQLETAAARLDTGLPESVGDWQAGPVELDAEALRQAGAEGHWLRRFTNRQTGATVTILLLCGRTARMVVHRPEHCYQGAGYDLAVPAVPWVLALEEHPAGLRTAEFSKPEPGGAVRLRIFWSWLADGAWQAPSSPRFAFAGTPFLYKLYAIREMAAPRERLEEDPSLNLLRRLLPKLAGHLSPS